MFLSQFIVVWREHAFMLECNVNSRRYYMCSGLYNSYVRLFDEAFKNWFPNGISKSEDSLWWSANAQNVSFQFLYGDQITFSTQLINPNFYIIFLYSVLLL